MTEEVKENRAAWAVALRSGEYKQIRGFLHDCRGYCPLGVACEVMAKRGVKVRRDKMGFLIGTWLQAYNGDVYRAMGLTQREQARLVSSNDNMTTRGGLDFNGIARTIEKETELRGA